MAGTVKANIVQLGDSATATQNLVIRTNVDGTFTIARGNAGATTQDILTIAANGRISFPQGYGTTNYSSIRLSGTPGNASTNTAIRRWTTVETSVGTDITYAASATLGDSFTINASGLYSIAVSTQCASATTAGILLNSVALTAGLTLAADVGGASGQAACASWTGYLAAGDVIRAYSSVTTVGATTQADAFTITRVG